MEKLPEKPKRGRPKTRVIKLDAKSPEEVWQRIFANAKQPDPAIRVRNRPA